MKMKDFENLRKPCKHAKVLLNLQEVLLLLILCKFMNSNGNNQSRRKMF